MTTGIKVQSTQIIGNIDTYITFAGAGHIFIVRSRCKTTANVLAVFILFTMLQNGCIHVKAYLLVITYEAVACQQYVGGWRHSFLNKITIIITYSDI